MKEYSVQFGGQWWFSNGYEANSKEEAVKLALRDFNAEADTSPFDPKIREQYVDDEEYNGPPFER